MDDCFSVGKSNLYRVWHAWDVEVEYMVHSGRERGMMCQDENRMEERFQCMANVLYSHFNSDRYVNTRVLNFSNIGAYMESDRFIKPGSSLLIRLNNIQAQAIPADKNVFLKTTVLAEVKWCSEISNRTEFQYGIGLRYFF